MLIQVVNPTVKKNNSFRTSPNKMFKDCKSRGWDVKDCTFKQLRSELVTTTYKSPDGKNTGSTLRKS